MPRRIKAGQDEHHGATQAAEVELPRRVKIFAAQIGGDYDVSRPVSKEEWDWASGDED